jgi:hypothetical protein
MYDVLDLREMLADEIVQRRESGHLVEEVAPEVVAAADDAELRRLLASVEAAPLDPGWPFREPSELEAIEAEQPSPPRPRPRRVARPLRGLRAGQARRAVAA